jgi:hypothetical protein
MSQTEQESRVYDEKFDYRYDPFTDTDESSAVTDESHVIPGSSPYYIQLQEVPKNEEPSTITITKVGQLDEDLDISETGVDVVRGADWAAGDEFTIDSETMYVDSVASNTLTVQRGYGGSSAATHNQYENVDTGTLDSNGETYLAHDSTTDFIAAGVRIGDIFENTTNSETATITDILTKTNANDTLYFGTGTATSNDNGDSWVVKRPRLLISTSDFTEVDVSPSAGEFQVHYGTVDKPYKRGLIRFHEDDKDKTVLCDYTKTGHYNWAEHLNILQDLVTTGRLGNIPRYNLKTGKGNASGTVNVITAITMQDYTYFPNPYTQTTSTGAGMRGVTSNSNDTIGRFGLFSQVGDSYDVDWRYHTSSDKPFIYAVIDKNTGKIVHLWICEDPPPQYWGHDLPPDDFTPPVILDNGISKDCEEVILFNYNRNAFDEIYHKASKDKTDKNVFCSIVNDVYEFDGEKKIFKPKNLTMI